MMAPEEYVQTIETKADLVKPKTKHAYCLPGGGSKGATQLGSIQALSDHGIEPDMIFCTSAGSLTGVMKAMGKTKELRELWEESGATGGKSIFADYLGRLEDGKLKANVEAIRDLITEGIGFGDKLGLITKKGQKKFLQKIVDNFKNIDHILDNTPLLNTLKEHVRMEDIKIPYSSTLVSLYDGALYTIPHTAYKNNDNFALGVLASTAIPGVCAPIKEIHLADGTVIFDAVDGGLRSSSPLPQMMNAIDFDHNWVAWAFNCNSINQQLNKSRKNLITQAGAAVDIMLNDGLGRDIKTTKKINQWAMDDPEWARRNGVKFATIFNVEAPLDEEGNPLLGSTLDFRTEWFNKRYELGYAAVKEYIDQL
jgi:NTE family protein